MPTGPVSYRALSLQSFSHDILEVLFKGPGYSIYRVRVQVHQAPDSVPSWSEVRAGPRRTPHPELSHDHGGPKTKA